MIKINERTYEVIDAHTHVWEEFRGQRFGDTIVETIGNGRVRQGDVEYQFLLPDFQDYTVKIGVLQGYMDMCGIDRALILQNPCYGDQRDYVSEIVRSNPKKFRTFGMIDPRKINTLEHEITTLINDFDCTGFKIEVPDVPFKMDAPEYDFMWRLFQEKNAIIAIDLGWGTGEYDFNIDRLRNVVARYPNMKVMIAHLGVSKLWDINQKYPYPELQKTLSLLDLNKENLYFDLAAISMFNGDITEYPFYRSQEILRFVKEFCGMDRIMWGSDMPSLLTHCTYQQLLDFIVKHCPFLNEDDLERVLSKNASDFIFS